MIFKSKRYANNATIIVLFPPEKLFDLIVQSDVKSLEIKSIM